MKIARIIVLFAIIFIINGKIQAQDDIRNVFLFTYERALKYNDRFEAKSALYKLLAMDPQNDSLLSTLAYLYFEAGQYASNVIICIDVLDINPRNTGALEMSGVSYENLGLKDKSLENYEKLYLITNDFEVLYKMAFLQYEVGKFQQAATNIEILLSKTEAEESTVFYTINEEEKEFPIKAAIYNVQGLVNQSLDNKDAARTSFEESLKISPDFVYAKQNLDSLKN